MSSHKFILNLDGKKPNPWFIMAWGSQIKILGYLVTNNPYSWIFKSDKTSILKIFSRFTKNSKKLI